MEQGDHKNFIAENAGRHGEVASSLLDVLEQSHQSALSGESFEDASMALDDVEGHIKIRGELGKRKFGRVYQIFQSIEAIQRSPISVDQKKQAFEELFDAEEARCSTLSPRVADFYACMLSELRGEAAVAKFKENAVKLEDLKAAGDLRALTSSSTSWEMKLNRIDARLEGYLAGRRALDKREGKVASEEEGLMRQEKLKKAPTSPPSRRNRSKPGMDEMSRLKEGERAPALWSILPALGGYFREQSLSTWDAEENAWIEPDYKYTDVVFVPKCEKENQKMGAMNVKLSSQISAGKWVSVPMPYTHGLSGIDCERAYVLRQDQNGDVVIMIEGEGSVEVAVNISPVEGKKHGPSNRAKIKAPEMPAMFSAETTAELERISDLKLGAVRRGRALRTHTCRHLTYSTDSSFNEIYDTYPDGYFAGIDFHRKADCDVGNTYFAAMSSALQLPVRHVVGHMVKGKGEDGASAITSGTGHAWSEVFDDTVGEWVRIDATPPGDPNMEEEDEKKGSSAHVPGDYGEQEAPAITNDKLEELRKKLAERKEELSYTREERFLAESTGVELKEARQIVKEIDEAERTKLPNGKPIVDVLSRLFNAIVESRKVTREEYDGPVSKEEGGEAITDLIRHKIGIMSGDRDPVTREKPLDDIQQEKSIGGFDLFMIGDKSGSMGMGSTVDGEALWTMQRRAEYLVFSALHRFQYALERAGIPSENGLSVRSQGISFRGDAEDEIDLDKGLSGKFTPSDKVKMWHSLGNQGGGNGDVAALNYVYGQILDEMEKEAKIGRVEKRLRLVIVLTDGAPDDAVQVHQYAEALGKLGAVVVGIGLTESAITVPDIYNTAHSRGDIAHDLNDLPAIIAKHLVYQAIKLFPAKAKESAKAIIESIISEFRRV